MGFAHLTVAEGIVTHMTEKATAWKRWFGYILCLGLGLILGFVAGVKLTMPGRGKLTDWNAVSQLSLIGNALKHYAKNHDGHLPASLKDLGRAVNADHLIDPLSGEEFKYVGAGRSWDDFSGDGVLAFTANHRDDYQYALFSSGYVMRVGNDKLTEELRKASVTRSNNTLERTGLRPVAQLSR
jgi:hypothetical protein